MSRDHPNRKQHHLNGGCWDCNAKAEPGRSRCARCLDAMRKTHVAYRARLRAKHLCTVCHKPIRDGGTNTWECRKCHNEKIRRARIRHHGERCYSCNGKMDEFSKLNGSEWHCSRCRDKDAIRTALKLKGGRR